MEQIEPDFILVELHFVDRRFELASLLIDHFFPLLDLLLFLLQLLDLFIDLLLHHLKQVLVLDLKLVHDTAEGLLQLVHLFVKLLTYFHFEFVVKFFVDRKGLFALVDFDHHFFDQLFHLVDFGGYLNNIVLHLCMFKDALRAEHNPAVLAVEFNLFLGMHIAEFDRAHLVALRVDAPFLCGLILGPHRECCEHRVVHRQVLGRNVVRNLIVRAFH